jgi:hypothetical protein
MLLAESDCQVVLDGGEHLPLGQEETLRAARTILQCLPTAARVQVTNQQPILVKTYSEPNQTTVLVVNTCPWSTEAHIKLALPRPVTLAPLGIVAETGDAAPAAPTTLTPGGAAWSLQLEPYAIQAVRIAAAPVQVATVEVRVSHEARAELAARLAELNNRDTQPHIYDALVNPGFEPIGGQAVLPGWRLLANPGVATVELDGTIAQQGATCLHVRTSGPLAVIESDPFAAPSTGQFAFTALVRGKNLSANSELRIVLETAGEQPSYRRFASVGGQRPNAFKLADQWCPYPLLVKDLPLPSREPLRVRFEVSGPGEWWIDDVKAYDLLFPLDFYSNGQTEWIAFQALILAAERHYQLGEVTDCLRYLEGYWPRFLMSHTGSRVQVARQPTTPGNQEMMPAAPLPAETPGFGEKFWRLFRR